MVKPIRVLFVCVANAGRSQMAEAFLKGMACGAVQVSSAGSEPGDDIHPVVRQAMREKGYDLAGQRPKGFDAVRANASPPVWDLAVTLCEDEVCPRTAAKEIRHWPIPDPKGKPIDEVRKIRDQIESLCQTLLAEIVSKDTP